MTPQMQFALTAILKPGDCWVFQGGNWWLWSDNTKPVLCDRKTMLDLMSAKAVEYSSVEMDTVVITQAGRDMLYEQVAGSAG